MSAFQCSEQTISIVVYAIKLHELSDKSEVELFDQLWLENELSLQARYGDDIGQPNRGYQEIKWAPLQQMEESVSSYHYQSCEHEEWAESDTCQLIENVADSLREWQLTGTFGIPVPLIPGS